MESRTANTNSPGVRPATSGTVSSTEHSVYSGLPEPSSSSRIFHVYHTSSHHNLRVTSADKTHLFYVKNSSFSLGKPDVMFHAGQDQKAPVAAACKFIHFSGDCKVALGDPDDVNNVVWEHMTKDSKGFSRYRWETTIYSGDGPRNTPGNYGERRSFFWKRTHSAGVEDSMPARLGVANFKLVDEHTGELIAVYANNGLKSFRKFGKFQINADYGSDFDTMALITCLSLHEKQRRRSRRSA